MRLRWNQPSIVTLNDGDIESIILPGACTGRFGDI